MKQVLLISMPFASIRYPSPSLGLLESLLKREGIGCEILYLNVFFHAFCRHPSVYEAVADLIIMGEWVFGEVLFGGKWAQTERGGIESLSSPLLPAEPELKAIKNGLALLRSMAGPFIRSCMDALEERDFSIVGFTSVYSQQVASLALAQEIKRRWPDRIVACGGANCEGEMGRAMLRLFPFVDWVFDGEADLSFPKAVKQWIDGRPPEGIPGVSFRHMDKVISQGPGLSPEMDDLPYPNFDDYFSALEKWAPDYRPFAPISLEFSRGCWWGKKSQCIFCGLNCQSLRYRRKSPERAEKEVKTLTDRYRTDRVILTDSILDARFFKTLLPALAEWGGLEELFLEVRANLTREQIRLLRFAGVTHFQPGIESLDTEMLAYMGKGTRLLQNIQLMKWTREFGIYPTWNLLFGFPGENSEAYRRMSLLIPSLMHLCPPMDLSPVLLVRFSPLYENSTRWGLRNLRAHPGYRSVYPFEADDLDALAYFFEAEYEGKENRYAFIGPLKQQVDFWKHSWSQNTPPQLSFEQLTREKIIIHDTRPFQKKQSAELEGDLALAYLACDEMQSFESLAAGIRRLQGNGFCGELELRRRLDELVARRLMIREEDTYLSLATRPVQRMGISEEW